MHSLLTNATWKFMEQHKSLILNLFSDWKKVWTQHDQIAAKID